MPKFIERIVVVHLLIIGLVCPVMARNERFELDMQLLSKRFQGEFNRASVRLKEAASPDLRKKMDEVSVIVDSSDWNVFGVRAERIGKSRKIIIPIGFIVMIFSQNEAVADNMLHKNTDALMNYFIYTISSLKENVVKRSIGNEPIVPLNYCQFLRRSGEECSRSRDDKYLSLFNVVEMSAYSFVLAHEYGHHVLGHLDGDTPHSQLDELQHHNGDIKFETDADLFATDLLVRSGLFVDGALGTFFFFSAFKTDIPLDKSNGTHPHPLCRWTRILERELEILPRNEKLYKIFINSGNTIDKFAESLSALQATTKDCHKK